MEPTILKTSSGDKDEHQHTHGVSSLSVVKSIFILITIAICICAGVLYRYTLPPASFVPHTLVIIPSGYSVKQIGTELKTQSIVRSQALFSVLVTRSNKDKGILAGEYLFDTPASVWEVVRRLTEGDHGIKTHRITFPEGVTVDEMGEILAKALPDFNREAFLSETETKEGYLFPDTYFFYSTATSGPIVRAMEENFAIKTESLHKESDELGKVWSDVVNMASIVEKEAATAKDRRIVAGILERRIAGGMRLQVDAPFMYSIGKASLELMMTDLESDSPYNTYRHAGLPPTPIANPGADAIASVIHPEVTKYLYYLSDKNGTMYYAKTFDEHKLNKAKYLK